MFSDPVRQYVGPPTVPITARPRSHGRPRRSAEQPEKPVVPPTFGSIPHLPRATNQAPYARRATVKTIVAEHRSPMARLPHVAPMNPLRRPCGLALAGALLLLGACASSPMSRIDAKRAVYETWPIDVQEAVVRKQVIPGLTPEMVEVALGKPTEVQSRVGKVGPEEVWIYRKSSAALPGLLRHTGLSGVGVSTGTSGRRGGSNAPSKADDQEIVFRNGTVLRGAS